MIVAALLLAGACGDERGDAHAYPIPGDRRAGSRVTVEVLNASGRAGLARAGVFTLRRAGIDVVYFGNAPDTATLDSTRIVVRRGDAAVGEKVRAALKLGRVSVELDASRLLDVSVLLGRDFAPRLELHP